MKYDYRRAAARLKEEMARNELSPMKLAIALSEKYPDTTFTHDVIRNYISQDSYKRDESTGEYTKQKPKISGMSLQRLTCLADFFGVSTEYLAGNPEAARSQELSVTEIMKATGLSEAAIEALSPDEFAPFAYADLINIIVDYNNEHLEDEHFPSIGYTEFLYFLHIRGMEQESTSPTEPKHPLELTNFKIEQELALLYAHRIGNAVTVALSNYANAKYRSLSDSKPLQAMREQVQQKFERELAENMKGESE